MRSRALKLCGVCLLGAFIAVAAIFILQPQTTQAEQSAALDNISRENIVIQKADGEEVSFSVELALTEDQQAQGLMNRLRMPQGEGMLFVFDDIRRRAFWMRNTLIPLDILFLDRAGMIKRIHPMAKPLDESLISSGGATKAVLEINGGLSEMLGIKIGDKVIHDAFLGH